MLMEFVVVLEVTEKGLKADVTDELTQSIRALPCVRTVAVEIRGCSPRPPNAERTMFA
jgi:hypothetical protein